MEDKNTNTGNTGVFWTKNFERVDGRFLDENPDIKVIASPTTGLNHVDIQECEKRGVKVISLRGSELTDVPSVAELTIWFMLELLRRPHAGRFLGNQLKDKTIGVVGLGRIGKQVASRLRNFEVQVCVNDVVTFGKPYSEYLFQISLADLLKCSDIVSLNVPLNEETEGMITEEHLQTMKPSAFIINTSRSQILKEGAIEKAIREKWIAGYGADVVRDDKEMAVLTGLRQEGYNVVITEHIGGNTTEARKFTDDLIEKKVGYLQELNNK